MTNSTASNHTSSDRARGDRAARQHVHFAAGDALGASLAPQAVGLPADLIQDDEVIILLIRPSAWYILLGSLGRLALIAIITMMLAYLPNRITWLPWTDANAFTLGAGLVTLSLAWQTLDWFGRVYVLTDRRLIRKKGVLRVAVFEAALSRIQHTSVFRSMRERLTGVGTIGFATAGSDTYEAFWAMIARPYAVHKTVVEAINRYGRRNGAT